MTIRSLAHETPIGLATIAACDGGIVGVFLDGQRHAPATGAWTPVEADAVLDAARTQLDEYFAGTRTAFDLPLAAPGSRFARAVWERLRAIPYGTTSTYGAIAAAVGSPSSARAVGSANAHNPIAIVVPCHRVVGANGHLTGYAGGLDRKQWLLAHEAAHRRD